MDFGEIIAAKRREKGLNQSELAKKLSSTGISVSNQAVSKWENGATLPNAKQFLALCEVLDIEDIRGAFIGGGDGILRGLSLEGRHRALDYIQLLRESGRYGISGNSAEPGTLPVYSVSASAGTGKLLDVEYYKTAEANGEVPEEADFGVRVPDNSMEPELCSGQTVWARRQGSIETGETGVFLYDGSAYLKQLTGENDIMLLHSLNPEYEDIEVSPGLPLRVLGKILH